VVTLLCCLLAAACVCVSLRRWAVWRGLVVLVVVPVVVVGLVGSASEGSSLALALASAALTALLWRDAPPAVVWLAGVAVLAGAVVTARAYADAAWEPGTVGWVLLMVGLLPALAAALGLGRARGSAVVLACSLAVLGPLALVLFAHTETLAALAWWPAAGALGVTALLRGRRGAAAERSQVDDVDAEAMRAFSVDLGGAKLPAVAIVIAAYNEAEGLPDVLRSLPTTICGLETRTIVVDDGSKDGTAEAARATGRALVVACTRNRGQGAALRLGYRLARTHGASYVVTTDADGQYDVADLPAVLQPILDGRADFVTGSRRLGTQNNKDSVRMAGTYVFAWLASALVGQRLTDTSFGLRAMRAEVTAAVTLNQPQYQSSELLVGVASHGYRVLEVPGTMHVRNQGSSKKGGNLVYGSRYARVMLGTWWREGAPAPVADLAPALRGSRGGAPAVRAAESVDGVA
jgi:hypothetical protein